MKPARASSAVILVRDSDSGIEIFMGQRHGRATFASTFVFPGGVLGPEDAALDQHCRGLAPGEADKRLAVASGGLEYYSAAIRELFEETGVLLATDASGDWVAEAADGRPSLAETRRNLTADKVDWRELLSGWAIGLATDRLHYVGHWETPLALSHRFSTRFFLADLPPGQTPEHDGEELIDSRWLKAAEALELHHAGEIELPFPHLKHLEVLAEFSQPESLRDWARDRWRDPVVKIRPWLIKENDERKFVLPGDPGYPDHA